MEKNRLFTIGKDQIRKTSVSDVKVGRKQSVSRSSSQKSQSLNLNFDIKQFHIHFKSVFTNSDMFNAFREHMIIEHNSESLDFLIDLDQFEDLEGKPKEQLDLIKHLVNTYLKEESSKALNIGSELKNMILKETKEQMASDKWIMEKEPKEIFDPLKRSILLEMKTDVFPRFVRSAACLTVVQKCKNNDSVASLKKTIDYPYSDQDFIKHLVTDQDFEFMKSIAEDNFDWELVGSLTSQLNAFWSAKNYLPKVSFFSHCSIVKFECIFQVPFEKVIISCLPGCEAEIFDANVMRIIPLEYYGPDQVEEMMKKENVPYKTKYGKRSICVQMMDAKLPFPLTTPRKYPVATSIDYDPENCILTMVHKPCQHSSFVGDDKNFDWRKKKKLMVHREKTGKESLADCHFMLDLQSYHIQKLDEKRTSFKQIHVYDLSGWATSQYLQKLVVEKRGTDLRKMLTEFMAQKKESTIEESRERLSKDGMGKLLLDLDIVGMIKEYEAKNKKNKEEKKEEKIEVKEEKVEIKEEKTEIKEEKNEIKEEKTEIKEEKNEE